MASDAVMADFEAMSISNALRIARDFGGIGAAQLPNCGLIGSSIWIRACGSGRW
jgi:hypothetical protein